MRTKGIFLLKKKIDEVECPSCLLVPFNSITKIFVHLSSALPVLFSLDFNLLVPASLFLFTTILNFTWTVFVPLFSLLSSQICWTQAGLLNICFYWICQLFLASLLGLSISLSHQPCPSDFSGFLMFWIKTDTWHCHHVPCSCQQHTHPNTHMLTDTHIYIYIKRRWWKLAFIKI